MFYFLLIFDNMRHSNVCKSFQLSWMIYIHPRQCHSVRRNKIITTIKNYDIIASNNSHTYMYRHEVGELCYSRYLFRTLFGRNIPTKWWTQKINKNKFSPITWLIHHQPHIWHYPVDLDLLYWHPAFDRRDCCRHYCSYVHCVVAHRFDSYHAVGWIHKKHITMKID